MIGDTTLTVNSDSDIIFKGRHFKRTTDIWELLTRKNVKQRNITSDDLRSYKKMLEMTNAHFTWYEPDGNIHITHGVKLREVIATLFPQTSRQGFQSALRRH